MEFNWAEERFIVKMYINMFETPELIIKTLILVHVRRIYMRQNAWSLLILVQTKKNVTLISTLILNALLQCLHTWDMDLDGLVFQEYKNLTNLEIM